MRLPGLLAALSKYETVTDTVPDIEITGIAYNSCRVNPGEIFVALTGRHTDGHLYIAEAVQKGAVAIVGEQSSVAVSGAIPYIVTSNSRAALALLAASFYDFPAQKLRLIGITGTDGKTTTATFIQSILSVAGRKAGMLTTIGATIGDTLFETGAHVTTPFPFEIQKYLEQMNRNGDEFAVLESTAQGLFEGRLLSCPFDVAVLTNITHEHLDYFGTFESYRDAKSLLFRSLLENSSGRRDVPKVSVLNRDDPFFDYFNTIGADVKLTFGLLHTSDFGAENISCSASGTRFTAVTPTGRIDIKMALPGDYNVANALAAMAACYSQGIPLECLATGIAAVCNVPARFEKVDSVHDFDVYIDYAHTPNALEKVLKMARALTNKRIIILTGEPGRRDRSKRPIMGEIAARLADKVVITADCWYDEDIDVIMRHFATGCDKAGGREGVDYWCIPDRREGIHFAITLAKPGDLVIIAGKGHETSLATAGIEHPWDEFESVREALAFHSADGIRRNKGTGKG